MNMALDFKNFQLFQKDQLQQIDIGDFSYCINDVIGRGSFSTVYKAKNKLTDQLVALKIIDLKRVSTKIQKVLLENQKNVIKSLIKQNFNGIIHYIQIVETPKQVCIAMEYCSRGDLQKIIKLGKLSEETAKENLFKILTAYIQLAKINIVHRDLKPSNILIDKYGDLKIADFGFAIFQQTEAHNYNYCVGSPAYFPPETLQKFQNGIKSDIWSLGVIVFKMLTTKTPWKGKNNKELINNMKNIPIIKSLDDIKDQLLKQFLIGCCKVQTSERFGLKQIENFIQILKNDIKKRNNDKQNSGLQNKQTKKQQSTQNVKILRKSIEKKMNCRDLDLIENGAKFVNYCL